MRIPAVMTFLVLWCSFALAQFSSGAKVYPVPADSKSNSISLTIANESTTEDASNVRVQVQRSPSGVKFASGSNLLKIVRAAKEMDASFSFDVGRDVKLNTKDTIEFQVSDRQGLLAYKSVVISYTGPTVYKLDQNFPNPFNPSTTIYYQVPVESKVKIMIYDILGREVKTLVNEPKEPGFFSAKFEANQIASGAYIYRMTAEPIAGGKGYVAVKKLMVLK